MVPASMMHALDLLPHYVK